MPYKDDEKAREKTREYYHRHKKRCLEMSKNWRLKHPEKVAEYKKRATEKRRKRYQTDSIYREEMKQKSKERQIEKFHKLHEKILEIIQEKGKCEKCGFSDIRALEIHHHFGNDAKNNYFKELKEIIEHKVPYSILCANCHKILHNPRKA